MLAFVPSNKMMFCVSFSVSVPSPNDTFPRSYIATTLAKSLTGVDGLAMPPGPSYAGMTYTPIGQYFFTEFTTQLAAINDGSKTGSEAADALQESLVAYATEQGFTVN